MSEEVKAIRNSLIMIAILLATLYAIYCGVIFGLGFREASESQYFMAQYDSKKHAEQYPELIEMLRESMSDGILTKNEYKRFDDKLREHLFSNKSTIEELNDQKARDKLIEKVYGEEVPDDQKPVPTRTSRS